jgi:hypothetical protein
MGDLEDISERVAHHGSPVAVWGVQRRFHTRRSGANGSVIRRVGIVDVDVEERWEQFTLACRRDHDERVTDAHFGRAICRNFAHCAENDA